MSLAEIGDAFGGRDHTTVIYACRKIDEERQTNPALQRTVDILSRTLREQA